MHQVWIEDPVYNKLCKYCKKHGSKMQVISTNAIASALKELERQQKEMEDRKL